ncbi:MAG: hypothetical protein M1820_006089 [Bogoriella megaspora]|nr:MAG: hypothetical protein M1820_006089 [Bogoriella megaspora]
MSNVIFRLLHLGQAFVSGYGLFVSYVSITNLQKYEEKSEKAAKWSEAAAEQLHKTRTTQAAGAIAILVSFLTSLYLAFVAPSTPSSGKLTLTLANAGLALAVRTYMLDFWQSRPKIPFVQGYNEAVSRTTEIMDLMVSLAVSWGVLGLAWASASVMGRREARMHHEL